jgi:hypothetical protein
LIKIDEAISRRGFDDFFFADGKAFRDEGVREKGLELLFLDPIANGIARAFFREDDPALNIDFLFR